jgi:hypothetical protein
MYVTNPLLLNAIATSIISFRCKTQFNNLKQTIMRQRIIIIKKHLDASTEEPKCQMCKEIAYLTKKQAPVQMVPVLFMFGMPQRILKITEVTEYESMGAKIKYIKETEIIL